MTEKELRRLNRHDILELLVAQTKETNRLRLVLEEREERLIGSTASLERLKCKLNEKDALIEKLKGRLDGKDIECSEQVNRLKSKLDEKDITIENLKAKLTEKDAMIESLSQQRFAELKAQGFSDRALGAMSSLSWKGARHG